MIVSPHGVSARIGLLLWAAITMNLIVTNPLSAGEIATIVVRGRVWTGNSNQPWAESVAIGHDRILSVGSRVDTESLVGPTTEVLDAGEGLVVPGFVDSHVHFLTGGAQLKSVQLRDATSAKEFAERIAEFAKGLPMGTWITGGNWDHTLWGGVLPDRKWIDRFTPAHPVWIQRLDGHMALANSAALQIAGIVDDISDIPGGAIASPRPRGD